MRCLHLPQTNSYLVVLTNGKAFECDNSWNYKQEHSFTRTGYNKAYSYIRFTYPNDLEANFTSWKEGIGWEFRLKDNTIIKFDTEGNLKPCFLFILFKL